MFYPTTCVGLRYGPVQDMLSGFSREHGYRRCHLARGLGVLSAFSTPRGFAYARYTYGLQRAIPSARGRVTSPSPHRSCTGLQILYCMSIGSRLAAAP